ncbi:hypothetical protein MGN70_000515 [Eutypa lata]|nr:hypothetical protein MGN70_000515 [Eutypa lata]
MSIAPKTVWHPVVSFSVRSSIMGKLNVCFASGDPNTTKASGEPVADAGTVDCYTLRVDIRLSHMRLDPQQARPAQQYSSGNGR